MTAAVQHVDDESFGALMETVRRFVRETLVPLEQRVEEEDAVPQPVIDQMKTLGFFGLSIDPEYGGAGLTAEQQARFQMVLSTTSPAFRYVYSSNLGIGSRGIALDGTPEQKQRYLPRLATGELVGCFALTEPGAGSDAGGITTRAVREGDDYIINGTKRYITNANRADVFTVMARTDSSSAGAAGVSAFLVLGNISIPISVLAGVIK